MKKRQENAQKKRPAPMGGEKARDFRGAIKRLLGYMARYRLRLIAAALLAAAGTAMQIIGPKTLGQATTLIFEGVVSRLRGQGGIDFARIGQLLLGLLALYAVSTAFQWVEGWLMSSVAAGVVYRMRRDLSEKIHRMPMRYFEDHAIGETLSRITNDVDAVGQSLAESATQIISGTAVLVGILGMMLSINWLMTLVVALVAPVSGLLIALIFSRSQRYFKAQQELIGEINAQVEEDYAGLQLIQAFGRQQEENRRFAATNSKLYESAWKSQFFGSVIHPLMNFVGNLGYVCVVVLGSVLAAQGRITIGDIQAFIMYARNFMQPIAQFGQLAAQWQTMAAAAERVFELLDQPEEEDQGGLCALQRVEGRIDFEQVSFGYVPEKTIIHDFTCHVQPGQTVAIVGQTGAGKTTMVKLLMRFYDVSGGRILVDGRDIRQYPRGELRRAFGMVLQDTWLFSGTIMENIRYGRLEATDEEVIAAARAAHADHFIRTLPGGYQMELNEQADNISQGQRQLLTIARAILADKPILILDEATSSVDTLTEQRIQRAMQTLMRGRTSFVIAHRLSTIREADIILLMKDGNIVEQGTHDQLMAQGGEYAQLYQSQFEMVS